MKISEMLRQPVVYQDASKLSLNTIFEEEPVPLTTFVQDRGYLANPELSPIQYEAVRYAEQIYYPDLYPVMVLEFGDYWKPLRMVNFLDLMWGKGGGKDHVCRMISLRIAYLLMCLKSPQAYYGMPEQDTIHLLNVASSSTQAQRAFFTPMTRAVKRGWFAERCHPSLNVIQFQPDDKNIEAISGHSDAESQEGLNLMLGIADEIDAFRSKDEMQFRAKQQREPTNSAEGILDMMQTSASTRFPEVYKNVRISYPRYLGSKIMILVEEGHADVAADPEHSRHYASGPWATWDVNPRVKGPESFALDYKKNPVLARAKYECKPAPAISPFMRNEQSIAAIFRECEQEPVVVEYQLNTVEVEDITRDGVIIKVHQWEPIHHFSKDLIPITGAQYSMHADIGLRRDFCGVALSHVSEWLYLPRVGHDKEEGEVEIREYVPYVKVDFVFSYEHDMGSQPIAREIQIRWIRQLYEDLKIKGFDISRVTLDSYQSAEIIQFFQGRGVEAEVVSTDKNPDLYDGLRDLIYDQRIECPYRARVQKELAALQKLPNGKIDHPPNGSKDEADALCASVFGALVLGGSESAEREQAYPGIDSVEVMDYVEMPAGMESGRSAYA